MEKFTNHESEKFKFENWIKAPIEEEQGEFERVINAFYSNEITNDYQVIDQIKKEYQESNPIELTEEMWEELQNTDSTTFSKNEWEELAEKMESHNRDWRSIKEAFEGNKSMNLPIIAKLPNEVIHLIAGNTRLCVAKVMDFNPQVVLLNFPGKYFKDSK